MSDPQPTHNVRVLIDRDQTAAELLVPGELPRELLTAELCVEELRRCGVSLNPSVEQAVADLVREAAACDTDLRRVVARGVPPRHGQDAHIQWLVAGSEAKDSQPQSHYDRSAFQMVKVGQVVGQIVQATDGEDGVDLFGKILAARPGKSLLPRIDESISKDAHGQLVAQADGVLSVTQDTVAIRQFLEVRDNVDFSTGNIEFAGDVKVGKGVRDCFKIQAQGSVEVQGLIEAATIECQGDLSALGGFASHGNGGQAQVGGSLRAKYLDNVRGQVRHDLVVDKEVINCELTVNGQIRSPHAAIIGGRVTACGQVEVAALGSPGAVTTHLVLGTVPRLEPMRRRLQDIHDKLVQTTEKLREQQQQLISTVGRRPTASDKERQTELTYELATDQAALARAQLAMHELKARIDNFREVGVKVHRALHAGVVLDIEGISYKVTTQTKGPLSVIEGSRGELLYRVADGQARPLIQIAHTQARAA